MALDRAAALVLLRDAGARALWRRHLADRLRVPALAPEGALPDVAALGGWLKQYVVGCVLLDATTTAPAEASAPSGGIRLAQQLRRDCRYRGLLLFVDFLPRAALRTQSSLFEPGIPGVAYLRLPEEIDRLASLLAQRVELTEAERRAVVADHCNAREQIALYLHEFARMLDAGCKAERQTAAHDASPRTLLSTLQMLLSDIDAQEAADGVRTLLGHLDVACRPGEIPGDDLRRLLARVHDLALNSARDPSSIPPAGGCPDHPPPELQYIFVADDDGYPGECQQYLQDLGYVVQVVEHHHLPLEEAPAQTYEQARRTLSGDPPEVFLCDITFRGLGGVGRDLMRLARRMPTCRLVIALSGAYQSPERIPEADKVCAGPWAKTPRGAQRVHELIWEYWLQTGRET
jgi:hypothetical protein